MFISNIGIRTILSQLDSKGIHLNEFMTTCKSQGELQGFTPLI